MMMIEKVGAAALEAALRAVEEGKLADAHAAMGRAAIQAMMEPTDEMLSAASRKALDDGEKLYETSPKHYDVHASPKQYWQAMLQAALDEKP